MRVGVVMGEIKKGKQEVDGNLVQVRKRERR